MKLLNIKVDYAPKYEKKNPYLFFLILFSVLFSVQVYSEDLPPIVTEQNLRSVILEGGDGFTVDEINDLNLNNDSQVDVADLIRFLNLQGALPQGIYFDQPELVVNEGNGSIRLVINVLPGYQGSIHYAIESTATPGVDFESVSGTLTANGKQATLEINLIDDLELEEVETINVTLIPDSGYQIGPTQQQTVYIVDNDSRWQGMIEIGILNIGFTMDLAANGETFTAMVKSDGASALPAGEWPVSLLVTETTFKATIGPIPVAAEQTLWGVPLERTLILSADNNKENELLDLNKIIRGSMQDKIAPVNGAGQFDLSSSPFLQGKFLLLKAPPIVPVAKSGLTDIN